ncbi:MAG: SDR family oxidoreductase [Tissierellia bacterium]|nr:SDR family oxidoreductase [Tissierellia bacterium]
MDKGGVVLLIASMMGHVVPPNPEYDKYLQEPDLDGAIDKLVEFTNNHSDVAYNFSKRGVHLMVRKNAQEFGKKGLRILSVSPGIIMTPMAKKAAEAHPEQMNYMKSVTPAGRNGEPEDIANAVEFLTSDKASFITGTDLLVDGGLANILPELMAKREQ